MQRWEYLSIYFTKGEMVGPPEALEEFLPYARAWARALGWKDNDIVKGLYITSTEKQGYCKAEPTGFQTGVLRLPAGWWGGYLNVLGELG